MQAFPFIPRLIIAVAVDYLTRPTRIYFVPPVGIPLVEVR